MDKHSRVKHAEECLSIASEQIDLGAKLFLVASVVQKKYLEEKRILTVFGPPNGCYCNDSNITDEI